MGYVKKNEFSRETEGERTPERNGGKRDVKMRSGNLVPGPRWSELLAQRTPPSVHSSGEFNALGRAAIKTLRILTRLATRARETRSSSVVELVPDYLLSR